MLKLGHHGAAGSTSTAWIEQVKPIHLITTAGHHGSHGHPRCAVLDRFRIEPGKETTLRQLRPLEEAPTHPVECSLAEGEDPWDRRELSVSVWNSGTRNSEFVRVRAPQADRPRGGRADTRAAHVPRRQGRQRYRAGLPGAVREVNSV